MFKSNWQVTNPKKAAAASLLDVFGKRSKIWRSVNMSWVS